MIGAVEPASTLEQGRVVQKILAASDNYKVLQVQRDATTAEINRAYKRLALQIQPDKTSVPNAIDAFKIIH